MIFMFDAIYGRMWLLLGDHHELCGAAPRAASLHGGYLDLDLELRQREA